MKKPTALVLLGRSGAGKGTQAEFIKHYFGKSMYHLGTGKLARSFLGSSGTTQLLARRVVWSGRKLPDWLADFLWFREFISKGLAGRHILFDGSPRSIDQAKFCDEVMKWHGRPLPFCVYLTVSKKSAVERLLKRGRRDDTPKAIGNRMEFFDTSVSPVISYYKKHGRLIVVDGEPDPRAVWEDVKRGLRRYVARGRA